METELITLREELDRIDSDMAALYERRLRICKNVAEYKIKSGKPVLDAAREKEKTDTIMRLMNNDFDKKAISELYRQIMIISRRYQYGIIDGKVENFTKFEAVKELAKPEKVVYQGTEGAYSQMAAESFFKDTKEIRFCHVDDFEDAVSEVKEGNSDYAVIPLENSSAGVVADTFDLLTERDVSIVGDILLPVSHVLLGQKGTRCEEIKRVYSHPQGLMQCRNFLLEHKNWQQVSCANTAVAAKKISSEKDRTQVAIASESAGKLYGLEVLKRNLSDNQDNATRFVVLSGKRIYKTDAKKLSLTFELPHKSGSLYNILGNFIFNNLNMLKIESRPIRGKNWEYRFFTDIEGNLADPAVKNAIAGINSEAENFRVLGNY